MPMMVKKNESTNSQPIVVDITWDFDPTNSNGNAQGVNFNLKTQESTVISSLSPKPQINKFMEKKT